jgi:hypothetical protein
VTFATATGHAVKAESTDGSFTASALNVKLADVAAVGNLLLLSNGATELFHVSFVAAIPWGPQGVNNIVCCPARYYSQMRANGQSHIHQGGMYIATDGIHGINQNMLVSNSGLSITSGGAALTSQQFVRPSRMCRLALPLLMVPHGVALRCILGIWLRFCGCSRHSQCCGP